jgi:hypothetical protein
LIEFADDLITVDERCIGCGGLVHTSKFTAFMALKVVVCIDSDSVENAYIHMPTHHTIPTHKNPTYDT